jgi:hypothetical protein
MMICADHKQNGEQHGDKNCRKPNSAVEIVLSRGQLWQWLFAPSARGSLPGRMRPHAIDHSARRAFHCTHIRSHQGRRPTSAEPREILDCQLEPHEFFLNHY